MVAKSTAHTNANYSINVDDWQGHLNPDGASKATAFLGAWLKEHYDLPDRRGDSAYTHWDDNLAQYEAYRAENWTGK